MLLMQDPPTGRIRITCNQFGQRSIGTLCYRNDTIKMYCLERIFISILLNDAAIGVR
jgi:hypothetical protein